MDRLRRYATEIYRGFWSGFQAIRYTIGGTGMLFGLLGVGVWFITR